MKRNSAFYSIVLLVITMLLGCYKVNAIEYHKNINGTRIILVKGDITRQKVDVIVNAANENLAHGGGVALAISKAAGPQLQSYSNSMPLAYNGKKCLLGGAVITPAFNLKKRGIKHIIHAVGPFGKTPKKEKFLRQAYQNSLNLAVTVKAKSIAFPAISTAIFGYDIQQATPVAIKAVLDWIEANKKVMTQVRFVVFSQNDFDIYKKCLDEWFTYNC